MKRETKLFVDQYGNKVYASSVRQLRENVLSGGCRVSKMFVDGTDGKTYHTGYVVGPFWFTAFVPYRKEEK